MSPMPTPPMVCSLALRLARWVPVLAVVLASPGILAEPVHGGSESTIDVHHYSARVVPDLASGSLRGSVEILLDHDGGQAVFDTGALQVDAVRLRGQPVPFTRDGTRLQVSLPAGRGRGTRLQVDYHGAPRHGLEFHPERNEIYTIFSTSQWLVVVDAPSERATLDLRVVVPEDYSFVASGRPIGIARAGERLREHHWRLDAAAPSFTYGFAAGRYRQVVERAGRARLRYLSTDLDDASLRRVFADTSDMLRFFGERAGIPYRGEYSQVLVTKTIGQEAAGLALLSEEYGRSVLEDPKAAGLIAHEVAHQWWGISVTCTDWRHFWLNEGFATFMAAVYMGHRHGEAEYTRQVERWKTRWERLRSAGADHALVYERWHKPTADDRAVVYQKAAYVLHMLRQELGEETFWKGIRAYTQANQGSSVDTATFQDAMSRASDRDLSGFFATWVEGLGPVTPAAP